MTRQLNAGDVFVSQNSSRSVFIYRLGEDRKQILLGTAWTFRGKRSLSKPDKTTTFSPEITPRRLCDKNQAGAIIGKYFPELDGATLWGFSFCDDEPIGRVTASANIADARRKSSNTATASEVVKLGDVFCHSWGYDQTNVEFYQVVEVGNKSVKVREIGAEVVAGSEGFMSNTVKPKLDAFVTDSYFCGVNHKGNPPKRCLVKVSTWDSKRTPYITGFPHGYCGMINPTEARYQSWYA